METEQILNALKAKLREQDNVTEKYYYHFGLYDAIKIVETFVNKDKDKVKEFEQLARPMMSYLYKNYHPHVTVVITPTNAELLEGQINLLKDYQREQLHIANVSNMLCGSFDPDTTTSSATKCKCGREKWEHTKAT